MNTITKCSSKRKLDGTCSSSPKNNYFHQKLTEKEVESALTWCQNRGGMYNISPASNLHSIGELTFSNNGNC